MFGGDVIVGAILGGAIVLLSLFSLYLAGAATSARKQVKELAVQNVQLAEAGKKLSEELTKRVQPFMLTDEQLIKFAHMINNVREQMDEAHPSKRLVH